MNNTSLKSPTHGHLQAKKSNLQEEKREKDCLMMKNLFDYDCR